MEIRTATDADAEAVSLLHRDIQALHARGLPHLFRPPTPESFAPERVRSLLQHASVRILIGVLGAEPIGYVFAEIVRQGGSVLRLPLDYVYVNHLAVAPAQRRRGYGSRLLRAVTDVARAEGVAGVALDVWAFNSAAQAFYAAQGFAPLQDRLWRDVPGCETVRADKPAQPRESAQAGAAVPPGDGTAASAPAPRAPGASGDEG
jgi:ribosomal protein S18 acetylase RimI-like enzyme